MHSVLALTALMASAAIANPLNHAQFHEKRQDVVDVVVTDVVYATAVVTAVVTATAGSEDVVDAASSAASVASVKVYSNNWRSLTWYPRPSSAASTSTSDAPAPASSSTTPVAVSSTPIATSTVVVSSPTSTYVAPTTTDAPVTSAAPTTAASTPISSTVASTTATGGLTSYSDIALYHHNIHRSNHSAPAATWNLTLVQAAQDWAQACNYSHNTQVGGGGYGQNIAAGVQADNVSAIITDLFYNGEVNWYAGQYGLANPSFTNFEHWG